MTRRPERPETTGTTSAASSRTRPSTTRTSRTSCSPTSLATPAYLSPDAWEARLSVRDETSIARGYERDLGGDARAAALRAVHVEMAVEGLDARREAVEPGALSRVGAADAVVDDG